ncbi:hypothetical protein [Methylobacterium sp. Leaf123]|uniref:hypothetical protein n=1 Tax=Methylobacterium sp. Leaf123 TaxID=1736264 RepID=UPI000A5D28D7|nr:hypothetical protein [Methylobacterium sp. Leaf123]
MAIVVKRNDVLAISNAADCLNFLWALYNQPTTPFGPGRGAQVNITNRFGFPPDVAPFPFELGVLVFGPQELSLANVLVLTADGNYTVISVPKTNIALRA